MVESPNDAERLQTALRWLESHHRRLGIQKKSLEHQLADVGAELHRIAEEIETAAERLHRLKKRP